MYTPVAGGGCAAIINDQSQAQPITIDCKMSYQQN